MPAKNLHATEQSAAQSPMGVAHDNLNAANDGAVTLGVLGTVTLLDQNDNVVGTYLTIQAAINASMDDYTVVVGAGAYFENLTVDKDITIRTINAGIPGDGTRGTEATLLGGIDVTADGVTIDGLAISGAIAAPPFTAGLFVTGNDFSLVNSVLAGPEGAVALFTAAGITGLNVGTNLVSGYSIGAYISGGTTTGAIHDNVFQGMDGTTLAGLGNGINSESSHVAIAGNSFDSLYSGALNLFPFGPDSVDLNDYVSGNSFTNGVERPIQILPTDLTHNVVGTDVNETFDAETAQISGVAGAFAFDGRGGDDHVFGGESGDIFVGGSGSDELYGKGGNDFLDGGTGNDLLDGGFGDDAILVQEGDTVIEAIGGGYDNVAASSSYTLAAGVEAEVLSTTDNMGTPDINLTGNEFDQVVIGNAGANVLDGGTGNDRLAGMAGDDILIVDAGDTVDELAGNGYDNVFARTDYVLAQGASIEVFSTTDHMGTANIDLTGNALAQIVLGNAGSNWLDGGSGGDTLNGFGGDDFIFANSNDIVRETVGNGYDNVLARESFTLDAGAEVEVLSTTDHAGIAAINLTGNELGQVVLGNAGNNILDGGLGNDRLAGFGGNDTFSFSTALGANNVDTIADFNGGDRIRLDHSAFAGLGVGPLGAGAFVNGTAAGDTDDRIIYDQATGHLFYDADGSGAGAAVLFATLEHSPILAASDFTVI